MKKILIDEVGKSKFFKDDEIVYPFCFKTRESKYNGICYYRYLEDGRFEHLCIQDLQMHLTYGNHSNFIHSLVSDNDFYFKVLNSRHITITEEEFEEQIRLYYERYQEYRSGCKYIAIEVEKVLSQQKDFYNTRENNSGIIENNEDVPF